MVHRPLPRLIRALGLLVTLWSAAVSAQTAAPTQRKLSQYEQESVQIALRRVKGEIEPSPEGKRVESIEMVRLDMIDDRDFLPNFLNFFHYTTRRYVIEREILLEKGRPFALAIADETERNLRALPQFTVVLVVPMKGHTPDTVRVVVITKDVLSLRLDSEPRFVNGKLDQLVLRPSEQNVLGTHHVVSGLVSFNTHSYSLGGSLYFPRIAGSRINAAIGGGGTFNCDTGTAEGHFGSLSVGQPLYSTRTKWAWSTGLSWVRSVERPTTAGEWICSGGTERPSYSPNSVGSDTWTGVPDRYIANSQSANSTVTRSFGVYNKYNVAFGLEARRVSSTVGALKPEEVYFAQSEHDANGEYVDANNDGRVDLAPRVSADPSGDQAIALENYRRRLETSDTRISPFVELRTFQNRFLRLLNYEFLGMQEDQYLGHFASLRLYPSLEAWGSTRNLFGVVSSIGYTWPVDNGFVRTSAASRIEFAAPNQSDASFDVALRFVTPDPGFGRMVFATQAVRRVLNYTNSHTYLGGLGRLRGYRPNAFYGWHHLIGNAEYRTPPVQVLSVLIGGALFYDLGDAFYMTSRMRLKSGAGGGLRLGFPQLQSTVFRIDAGFPLTRSAEGEVTIVGVFGQAI